MKNVCGTAQGNLFLHYIVEELGHMMEDLGHMVEILVIWWRTLVIWWRFWWRSGIGEAIHLFTFVTPHQVSVRTKTNNDSSFGAISPEGYNGIGLTLFIW